MHTAHLIGDLKHIYSLCCLMTMKFWSCDIEEMPKLDELKLIKEADMLVSRRNGKSVAYPAGTITEFCVRSDCAEIFENLHTALILDLML